MAYQFSGSSDAPERVPAVDMLSGAVGLEQFAAVASIFDAAEMVIYVADMHTHEMLFMNSHAERLWGKPAPGAPCYKILQAGQEGPCAFCTNPRLIAQSDAVHPVVWEFQNTVNKRWYLCIDKAIPWQGRQVRMEVAIDITERKQHEQFRRQYVGLISHDLRAPLSAIGVGASLLKVLVERGDLAGGAPAVDVIQRSTQRMAEMIDDLLETTQLESGGIKLHKLTFNLAELAASVARQLGAGASRTVHCRTAAAVVVLADAGRIERVLENLVGNAIRYSAPGQPLIVEVSASEREARVTVTDSGAGIPAADLPKLFQPFFRATGAARGGMGLGLYNSRLIVEHHGGRIWAESTVGVGSTFGFALPLEAGTGS